ncbi:LytTR family transcriptional regulator [Sphingobacterium sp. KU25419]|nr:LytTR family transcriptional regulator [Sphingobacterium sp. KU25419]
MYNKSKLFSKWWIRLVLAIAVSLLVSEYGSPTNLFLRLHTWDFYNEYATTLVITVLIVEWVHYFHYWLERKFDWRSATTERLLLQFLLTFIAPALLVYMLASLYFFVHGLNIHKTDYLYYAYPFIVVLISLLNFLYITVPAFLSSLKEKPMHQLEQVIEPSLKTDVLPVVEQSTTEPVGTQYREFVLALKGSDNVKLMVEDIACIFILNSVVFARTYDRQDYILSNSLDEVENELDPQNFFRANRKLIVHFKAFTAYSDAGYGKLELTIEPLPDVPTIVSQLKARSFKEWLDR